MSHKALRILFISDSEESLQKIKEVLERTDLRQFELDRTGIDLSLPAFVKRGYDVYIVDCVTEGAGLISEAQRVGLDAPIIVLTANSATEVLEAIHQGASDCLVRDLLTPQLLERSICAVIDRAHALNWRAQYERYYQGLMENASDVIYTHDLEGDFTSINKAGEHLIGYTSEETLAMNVRQIIAPEFLSMVQTIVNRMLADRRRAFFETAIITKDGRRIFVNINVHLVYKEGTPIGIQGIARELWLMPSSVSAVEGQVTTGGL